MPTGRKPAPQFDGGKRLHRNSNEINARMSGQPNGCTAILSQPDGLSNDAASEWDRVVGLYKQLNADILCDLDESVLVAYCESVAIYKSAQREYKKYPIYGKNSSTNKAEENPFLKIMRREGQCIARYSEQLCLSPAGRARMGLAKAKGKEIGGIQAFMLKRGGG